MHHTTSTFVSSGASSGPFARFAPPTAIARWTGRAALTIPLPSLASLRLEHATGGGRATGAGFASSGRLAVRA